MNRREFLSAGLGLALTSSRGSTQATPTPARRVERLGASTACLAGCSLMDAIQQIQRLGFGTIEIIAYTGARHSIGDIPGFGYAAASLFERTRVFAATRGFQHITAHLPFQGVNLFSSDPAERQAGLARLRDALDGLVYLKGELGVMHVGWPEKGKRFRDIWAPMVATLRTLGDYAARA